jgi:hypothetical protein
VLVVVALGDAQSRPQPGLDGDGSHLSVGPEGIVGRRHGCILRSSSRAAGPSSLPRTRLPAERVAGNR